MKEQALLIENLFEKTTAYTKSSGELLKLKFIRKSASVISTLTARSVVIILFTLFFITFNIGAALWIGQQLGQASYGFLIIAGFYLIPGCCLLFFGDRWIRKPLQNFIITQALKTTDHE